MQTIHPTKNALMDLAEQMLQTQSFDNVSFQALAKGVGIKKGSVYYHFESKEELGEAILDRTIGLLKSGLQDIKNEPVVKQLHIYTNWFAKHIGAAEKLCPGASFAASWDALPATTQAKVKSLYQVHLNGLSDIIERGRQTAEFTINQQSSREMATVVFALLQGGLLAARVSQDPEDFLACKAQALKLVKQG